MRQRTALYRFFNSDGVLLYVGITTDPEERWRCHALRDWWPQVAEKTIEWHEQRKDAEAAEISAIKVEKPLFNRTHADYHAPLGLSISDLRAALADVLNNAAVYGQITYVTNRGRRIAAVVPVPIADDALADE